MAVPFRKRQGEVNPGASGNICHGTNCILKNHVCAKSCGAHAAKKDAEMFDDIIFFPIYGPVDVIDFLVFFPVPSPLTPGAAMKACATSCDQDSQQGVQYHKPQNSAGRKSYVHSTGFNHTWKNRHSSWSTDFNVEEVSWRCGNFKSPTPGFPSLFGGWLWVDHQAGKKPAESAIKKKMLFFWLCQVSNGKRTAGFCISRVDDRPKNDGPCRWGIALGKKAEKKRRTVDRFHCALSQTLGRRREMLDGR